MWLASPYGIIWFDLKTYKAKLIPLPSAFIHAENYQLFEDTKQRLWIYKLLIYGRSLFLYEPVNNKFNEIKTRIATDAVAGKKRNIDPAWFCNINESENGDLFILGNYLLKFKPESFQFTIYPKIENTPQGYLSLEVDNDNQHLWLSKWMGLIKYNFHKDSMIHYNFERIGNKGDIENYFLASSKNKNELWLSNTNELRVFDKSTNKVFLYKKFNTDDLSATDYHAKGINGMEWFWNYKNGFSALLPSINRFVYHKILPANERVICQ